MSLSNKKRAPLNRTINISDVEIKSYSSKFLKLINKAELSGIIGKIINQDLFEVIDFLPDNFVDLLFLDPPYNLNKNFSSVNFKEMKSDDYEIWLDNWISKLVRTLKPNASIYFCCDWKTSIPAYNVLKKYFLIRNRITWEREKGRGSKDNWKNSYEDIWYCTLSEQFTFNVDAVKLKRMVRAPYKVNRRIGNPKMEKILESLIPQIYGPTFQFHSGLCLKTRIIRHKNLRSCLLNLYLQVQMKMI